MGIWKSNNLLRAILVFIVLFSGCSGEFDSTVSEIPIKNPAPVREKNKIPVIHVFVALCDNESQGIVPVPKHLGNGDDPKGNLYWGAAFGVETFFTKSKLWERLPDPEPPSVDVLQRIAFRHQKTGALLIADAYRGRSIKNSLTDFLEAASGNSVTGIKIEDTSLQINGGADVIVYVGHNGLMDFRIEKPRISEDPGERDSIVLACFSKKYFRALLTGTGTRPLLWTTNFMAPEAYLLHDALEGRLNGESGEQVRMRAAKAYARYQRITVEASIGLLVTGW